MAEGLARIPVAQGAGRQLKSLRDLRQQRLGTGSPAGSTHPESTGGETTHVSSSILIAKAKMSPGALRCEKGCLL